jgi:hypothetical protein
MGAMGAMGGTGASSLRRHTRPTPRAHDRLLVCTALHALHTFGRLPLHYMVLLLSGGHYWIGTGDWLPSPTVLFRALFRAHSRACSPALSRAAKSLQCLQVSHGPVP